MIFQIIWAYTKKYWGIAVAVVVFVVFVIVKLRAADQIQKLLEQLAENDRLHKEELAKIQASHDAEIIEHAEHLKQLEVTLKDVEAQYVAAKSQLDVDKKAEIKKLVDQYFDDPDELAKRLSEATGIPIAITK